MSLGFIPYSLQPHQFFSNRESLNRKVNSVLGVTSVDEKDYHNDAVSMPGKDYDLVNSHPLSINVFPKGKTPWKNVFSLKAIVFIGAEVCKTIFFVCEVMRTETFGFWNDK